VRSARTAAHLVTGRSRHLPELTPARRRFLWTAIVWTLTLGLGLYGVGYVTGSIVTKSNLSYAAFVRIPGEFVTHGVIQIGIACLMLYGLAPQLIGRPARIEYLRRVLAFPYGFYCGLTALVFLLAPVAGGTKNPAWVAWLAFSVIGYLLATIPPPTDGSGHGRGG
jgi:hypothetical protein